MIETREKRKCFKGQDAFTFTNLFLDQEVTFNYRHHA